jgi:hypothetical protein
MKDSRTSANEKFIKNQQHGFITRSEVVGPLEHGGAKPKPDFHAGHLSTSPMPNLFKVKKTTG